MRVILASSSPRRARLLKRVARKFCAQPANVRERIKGGEPYARACVRLAEEKAEAVAKKKKGAVVIGADTIAYFGKTICRKTNSKSRARRILLSLSGRTHVVSTGVCVIFPNGKRVKYVARAKVKLKRLDDGLLEWYLESGEWRGRAGCYDVSGKGARLVQSVGGEKETVAGLPLARLKRILAQACP